MKGNTLEIEYMKKLLADVRKDLENIGAAMKKQELMGGVQPQHMLQYLDVKTNLCIGAMLHLLEGLVDEKSSDPKDTKPSSNIVVP